MLRSCRWRLQLRPPARLIQHMAIFRSKWRMAPTAELRVTWYMGFGHASHSHPTIIKKKKTLAWPTIIMVVWPTSHYYYELDGHPNCGMTIPKYGAIQLFTRTGRCLPRSASCGGSWTAGHALAASIWTSSCPCNPGIGSGYDPYLGIRHEIRVYMKSFT